MTPTFLRACAAAAVLSVSMPALAQTPAQQPAQPQPRTQTTTAASQKAESASQTVTMVGCIQGEADYRKAGNLGRGGTAGSGVGVGNELVLIDAKITSAGAPPAAGAATGTTGATARDYKLTGANEGKAVQFRGKRVEVIGTIKPAASASPSSARRATDDAPQIDVFAGEDLRLPELDVTSVRATAGTCPAK